jgi:hypothetical protein
MLKSKQPLPKSWGRLVENGKNGIKIDLPPTAKPVPVAMPLYEFIAEGYLQELNRKFLHPLGLSLQLSEKDGHYSAYVADHRKVSAAVHYGFSSMSKERRKEFVKKVNNIESERQAKAMLRLDSLGFEVEPVDDLVDERQQMKKHQAKDGKHVVHRYTNSVSKKTNSRGKQKQRVVPHRGGKGRRSK